MGAIDLEISFIYLSFTFLGFCPQGWKLFFVPFRDNKPIVIYGTLKNAELPQI